MDQPTSQRVPKVHPLTRHVEPEDPMTLHATTVEGDPDLMIRAVVQEYSWMGWTPDQLLSLFRDPAFPVLHQLGRALGEAELSARVAAITSRFGVFRFQATVVETPDDPEPDPDFVSLDDLAASAPGQERGPR